MATTLRFARIHWLMAACLALVIAGGIAFIGTRLARAHTHRSPNTVSCGTTTNWTVSRGKWAMLPNDTSDDIHGGAAARAATCFQQSFQRCQAASLTIYPGNPDAATASYTVQPKGSRCVLAVKIGGGTMMPYTDTCAQLAWQNKTLQFSGCTTTKQGYQEQLG